MTSSASPVLARLRRIRTLRLGPLTLAGLSGTLAVVLGYLALVLKQADQAYVIDETPFPYAAEGALHHGAPYFYNGETRPHDLGMWHPPLYVYTLALHLKLFGSGYVAARMYGVVAVLAALAILILTVRRLAPTLPQHGYVLLAAVMLWNPLIVSGTLIPDIDTTLGLVAAAALLWLAVVLTQDQPGFKLFLVATGVWTLAWSTKFPLALLLGPVVMVAPLLRPTDRIRQIVLAGAAVIAGFTVFLVVFLTLAALANFPARAPWDYFQTARHRPPGDGLVDRLTNNLNGDVFWFLTPGLFVLAGVAIALVLAGRAMDVARLPTVLLFGAGIYLTVAYGIITGSPFGFPKYWPVAVLPLAAVIACAGADRDVARLMRLFASRRYVLAAAVVGAVAVAGSRWGEGRLIPVLRAGSHDVDRVNAVSLLILFSVAVVLGTFAALMRRDAAASAASLVIATAAVSTAIAAVSTQTSINLVHATAPYSTRYYLGERGLEDVITYLRQEVPPDASILSAKDIGLQSGRRFYEDAFYLPMKPADLETALRDLPATYLVTRKKWDYSKIAYPRQFKVFHHFFIALPEQPSPDFTVWIRRG